MSTVGSGVFDRCTGHSGPSEAELHALLAKSMAPENENADPQVMLETVNHVNHQLLRSNNGCLLLRPSAVWRFCARQSKIGTQHVLGTTVPCSELTSWKLFILKIRPQDMRQRKGMLGVYRPKILTQHLRDGRLACVAVAVF